MSCPFEDALEALRRQLRDDEAPLLVRRAEWRAGSGLTLSLESESGSRWFRYQDGELAELFLQDDSALPCSTEVTHDIAQGEAQLLSWRPGRRLVARASLGIVKGYRAGRASRAYAKHERARAACTPDGFTVPKISFFDRETSSLCFEPLEASPFDLENDAAPETVFRIGSQLALFQRGPIDDLEFHDRRAECRVLDRHYESTLEAVGEAPPGWQSVRARLDEIASRKHYGSPVLVHRDLHDGQLFYDGESFSLIDFDLLTTGESVLDVANLSIHFHLRALQHNKRFQEETVEENAAALLEGLGAPTDAGFVEALRFYQASSALRLALVYSLRPRWLRVVPELVRMARRCVEEMPA